MFILTKNTNLKERVEKQKKKIIKREVREYKRKIIKEFKQVIKNGKPSISVKISSSVIDYDKYVAESLLEYFLKNDKYKNIQFELIELYNYYLELKIKE